MRANEFCYWLQGYFEMADTDPPRMGARQVKIIKEHMALVHRVDPEHGCLFVSWLGMFLDSVDDGLGTADTARVRKHLASQFKHEIDPSYGGDQAALQAIHDGRPPGFHGGGVRPNGETLRC
jgi:hypothetical protein